MSLSLTQAVEEFTEELKEVKSNLDLCYEATLYDVGKTLVYYTPIRTGLASSNWNVTDSGSRSSERTPIEGTKGAASLTAISNQVKVVEMGKDVTFYNPVKYIVDLDKGTSRQAPSGMIVPTVPHIQTLWEQNLTKFKIT